MRPQLLLVGAALAQSSQYTCPDYSSIRQPSVDPGKWNVQELSGNWYLSATTEPTTKFCLCNVMNYTFYETTYSYSDTCYQDLTKKRVNITMDNMGGDLSYDATAPGIFHEAFEIGHHAVTPKNPNMLFDLRRNSKGEVTSMHFYACLGKMPPLIGKPLFSYLVYARDPWLSKQELQHLVSADSRIGAGNFDINETVYTPPETWKQCGVLPSTTPATVDVVV